MWKFPTYEINKEVDWELLENTYPWIRDMEAVPQDKEWHAEGNVLIHTKMVVQCLLELEEFKILNEQDQHILFAAALMHDIEKRSCTTSEIIEGKQRIISPGHAKKGAFTTRQILYKDIQTPFAIREQIVQLVRYHGFPLWSLEKNNIQKEVVRISQVVNTHLLAILAKADALGRICKDKEYSLLKVDLFIELCKENDCFGKARTFPSDLARFLYFNKENQYIDYQPFDTSKSEVILMSALPGTGKDTYIQKHLKDFPMLSLDELRRQHKISPRDKKGNGRMIQLAKEQAKEYLRNHISFVFNATNISKDMRSKWISLFNDYNAKIKIVYLETDYKTLLKQNKKREYPIPEDALERLILKLEIPSIYEAHDVIHHIKK